MNFEQISRKYLRDFQQGCNSAWASGTQSTELATRPIVHDFILKIVAIVTSNVTVHHESTVAKSPNRPDWRLEDNESFGVYAYGDHKGLSISGQLQLSPGESAQMSRYLELGRPVFVFDGMEFLFFDNDIHHLERIELIPKPLTTEDDWSSLPINPLVETKFADILESSGFRKWSEQELIQQLALRAKFLSESIENLLQAPLGSGASAAEEELLEAIHALWELIKGHHDPTMVNQRACADFIAQVLTFQLFIAHTRSPSTGNTPEERRVHILQFWPSLSDLDEGRKLRPFVVVAELLSDTLSNENAIGGWYTELTTVLAHAEYMGTEEGPADFHVLFEQFFSAYDKETKFDRGIFYTPPILTSWMARITDELLADHFDGARIGDVADTVIDPCCGTGGFIEAVIDVISESSVTLQYVGFEVLPASYALAHYRLEQKYRKNEVLERVRILLTDTLSDRLVSPPSGAESGFSQELEEAGDVAKTALKVVIGNPPSAIHSASSASRHIIERMLEDFRPPVEARTDRQNIQKALNNEAVRFLRWCAQKIIDSDGGILSLILPGAIADKVSFKYARKWLLDNFHHIYVVLLDEDARRAEPTHSLFNVLQGRMALFAIRFPESAGVAFPTSKEKVNVNLLDISKRSYSEKEAQLSQPQTDVFEECETSAPEWQFIPAGQYDESVWSASWPLNNTSGQQGIFSSKCSAVKLAPTSMLFHTEPAILKRRSLSIGALSSGAFTHSYSNLKQSWWQGQKRPPAETKLTNSVRNTLAAAASSDNNFKAYSYRPFVDGFAICDEALFDALGSTRGGGTRARPEIRAAFDQGTLGIAIAPDPTSLSDTLTRFASFVWHLPDNDIVARGNAMVYCNRYPEKKQRKVEWDPTAKPNINDDLIALFGGDDPSSSALFYIYAVLSSTIFQEAFEAVLYRSTDSDNPIRIPIVHDPEIRGQLSDLGLKAALCEKFDHKVEIPDSLELRWPRETAEIQLTSHSYDPETEKLSLKGSEGEVVEVLNVPSTVVYLSISGHDIVAKWLRERTFPYLRRTFRRQDAEKLQELLSRISLQQGLINDIDIIVEAILKPELLISPPNI